MIGQLGLQRTWLDKYRGVRHSSLLHNGALLITTTVLTGGLGYIYWLVAARGYDRHVIGLAGGLIAAQALIGMVCCLGVDILLIEVLPSQPDDTNWSSLVTVAVTTAAGLSLAVALVVGLALPKLSSHYDILHRTSDLVLFALGAALTTAGAVTDAVCISARRSEHMLGRNLVTALVKLPIMALPLLFGLRSVWGILASWTGALAVSLVIAYGYQIRRFRPGYRPGFQRGFTHLLNARRHIAAHFLTDAGSYSPQFLLPVIVVAMASAQANAYFYVAWSVSGIFLIISPAVATSLFAEGTNAGELTTNARRSVAFIATLLIPMIGLTMVLGEPVLGLFGSAYARNGTTLLRLLAVSAIPDAMTNLYVSIERVKGRPARAAALNVTMAIIAVTLTVVLTPEHGPAGPALAWLSAQSLGAVIVGHSVFCVLRPRGDARDHRIESDATY